MRQPTVYIAAVGIVSGLGSGPVATVHALGSEFIGIGPLSAFSLLHGDLLPVGQVTDVPHTGDLPRTHRLALLAADQAMRHCMTPPDAVIVGTTTGGMDRTEELLRQGVSKGACYRYHGLATVAKLLARRYDCRGPLLTISTACSSGATALAMAMAMIRMGMAKTVLAGGVDALCRLTYFGFHSLQLVDRTGAHPLDIDRCGMSVAEGAAMLLLSADPLGHPLAELTGAGLSCDAYHPTAPRPDGTEAASAIRAALNDAGLGPEEIDYINLHGTGTRENDLAEARAIQTVFSDIPPLSSIKGATGHSLAAAGGIEAVVATLAIDHGFLPANSGLRQVDPLLELAPLTSPVSQSVGNVLSNSFGFGGNNAALIISRPRRKASCSQIGTERDHRLLVLGLAALSGAGDLDAIITALQTGKLAAGRVQSARLATGLDPGRIRRLKRLPRMALSMAAAARNNMNPAGSVQAIFMGTGWGAQGETHDFLHRLFETEERFPSPTDFVGSVHNAPAGQVAMLLGATGANITTSGADASFEQALMTAILNLGVEETGIVLGLDEFHPCLSPLFDPSVAGVSIPADGGGACLVRRWHPGAGAGVTVRLPFFANNSEQAMDDLLAALGDRDHLCSSCGLLMVGIPMASGNEGEQQLAAFIDRLGRKPPIFRYRDFLGEFASSSALAAILAMAILRDDISVPFGHHQRPLAAGSSILVLGLGDTITAMEISRV